MKTRTCFKIWFAPVILLLTVMFASPGMGQEINLDKMKKVGDLVCYPSLKDPAVWYYLPDQPRLAMKNGKPQFSFMKYSRTNKQGKAGTNVAEGGGIVHFLVTYGTSKDRVNTAQKRLQKENPDARIQGPIIYRKGSFALITSFKEDQAELVKTVAVGKAPLMEGQKAAVSMALTRSGAELLWESFKTDTPDISIVFDMEFVGIREPYEATIEADWSRVSKHKRLKAGMKYSWFGADVDMLFQELRQNGAIKITTKGENASMDKIVQSAHTKLLQVMFDPAPVDDLSKAASEKDSYSNLNQAMKLLKENQKSTGKSSLNMNTPGFSQLIAAILDIMIPNAHAAEERKLTKDEQKNLSKKFNQAKQLYKAGNYEEALELFIECDQIHQDITGRPSPGGNIYSAIGHCSYELSEYHEAADNYKMAADRWGRETKEGKNALKNAALSEKMANKNNQVNLKQSKELSEQQKEELREIFRRSYKLREEGKYQAAHDGFKEVLGTHQTLTGKEMNSPATRYNLALCLMGLKRYKEAANAYIKAAQQVGPETPDGKKWLQEAEYADKLATSGSPTDDHKNDTANLNKPGSNNPNSNNQDSNGQDSNERAVSQSPSDAYNSARKLDDKARQSNYNPEQTQAAINAYEAYQSKYSPTGSRAKEIQGRLRSLNKRLATAKKQTPSGSTKDQRSKDEAAMEKALAKDSGTSSSSSKKKSDELGASGTSNPYGSALSKKKSTTPSTSKAAKPSNKKAPSKTAKRVAENKPGFSLVASYQMKNIKRSGKMVYKMNHFRSESQSFAMAENIGSLYRRYKNDSRVFKAVTIDDPVFKQREILVTLDGQDSVTFTKYLNFVTVKMKKRHQSGDTTTDEVVITPESFNQSGNSFSLNYGYKDDTNRTAWLNYQYQVIWSFHGGVEVRSAWKDEDNPMLSLLPPHRYKSVTIEGEGEDLTLANVRHAVITINSMIGGKQITTEATIKNKGPAPALHLDVPQSIDGKQGNISIKWFLKGGKKVTSPVQKLEGDIIYWDELPEEGRM